MKKYFTILLRLTALWCCVLLSSCGGTLQTYSGEPKSKDSISIVRRGKFEFAGTSYFTSISNYARKSPGQKLDFTRTNNIVTGEPNELQMIPGDYVLLTRCFAANRWAVSSIEINLEAGATYEVLCGPVPDQLNVIHTFAKKIEPGQ